MMIDMYKNVICLFNNWNFCNNFLIKIYYYSKIFEIYSKYLISNLNARDGFLQMRLCYIVIWFWWHPCVTPSMILSLFSKKSDVFVFSKQFKKNPVVHHKIFKKWHIDRAILSLYGGVFIDAGHSNFHNISLFNMTEVKWLWTER